MPVSVCVSKTKNMRLKTGKEIHDVCILINARTQTSASMHTQIILFYYTRNNNVHTKYLLMLYLRIKEIRGIRWSLLSFYLLLLLLFLEIPTARISYLTYSYADMVHLRCSRLQYIKRYHSLISDYAEMAVNHHLSHQQSCV